MQIAVTNKSISISPQKSRGSALPSAIEKRIATIVRGLRERKFPVFSEEVRRWAAEAIEGTDYAEYFVDGKPTVAWYKGWLKRMEFGTRVMRPLKQTRHEWFTPENLDTYFEVAKYVLLDVGVAVQNPHYYPQVPFSEEVSITRPERICSYDETKMELDCTKGGAGKRYRFVNPIDDDGEMVVTKSSSCVSDTCGLLGDGRKLPVDIVFASGETHDSTWAPEMKTPDILDKDGKPLSWRYTCNLKGSVNEEFCADYIEHILQPSLSYPLPRDTHPGEQGVIVCDGVGIHLCFAAIEKAIELRMDILLRIPNLSFALHGEDTVNSKVSTYACRC